MSHPVPLKPPKLRNAEIINQPFTNHPNFLSAHRRSVSENLPISMRLSIIYHVVRVLQPKISRIPHAYKRNLLVSRGRQPRFKSSFYAAREKTRSPLDPSYSILNRPLDFLARRHATLTIAASNIYTRVEIQQQHDAHACILARQHHSRYTSPSKWTPLFQLLATNKSLEPVEYTSKRV